MPSTENQGSSTSASSFGRAILSFGRGQIHSNDASHGSGTQESEFEPFQKLVSDHFHDLSLVSSDEFLCISWLRKLLDAFIFCQEDFRAILLNNKAQVLKPPLDKLISEFFERSVKALDICNAARDGIEKIKQWEKYLEIVLCALDSSQKTLGEGQVRRARKALMDLAVAMIDEKDSGSAFPHRNRSFGRHSASKDHHSHHSHSPGHSRSLSWSVSRSWSAVKQLQSIANNLVPPRGAEIAATNGLALVVFTMNFVLLFVLWALVAAIPCQDRGLQVHFSIPRQFSWGNSFHMLHERIMEEGKKRERKNSNGLLKEIQQMEKCSRRMTDILDLVQFPMTEEQTGEVGQGLEDLALACEVSKNGLDPLESQLREMFRKIISCRTAGLDVLCKPSTST